jgi:hypothetical protein
MTELRIATRKVSRFKGADPDVTRMAKNDARRPPFWRGAFTSIRSTNRNNSIAAPLTNWTYIES